MTDADLVEKKLAFIETCVRDAVANGLGDLTAYIAAIRDRVTAA